MILAKIIWVILDGAMYMASLYKLTLW